MWMMLTTVGAGLVAIVSFLKSFLDLQQKRLQLKKMIRAEREAKQANSKIIIPTQADVLKYGKSSARFFQVGVCFLVASLAMGLVTVQGTFTDTVAVPDVEETIEVKDSSVLLNAEESLVMTEHEATVSASIDNSDPIISETVVIELAHGKEILKTFTAKVIGLTDGDTVKILNDDKEEIRIRLDSIDSPEKRGGQPFYQKAKQALADMVFGKVVTFKKTKTDRWGRPVAFLYVDDIDVCAALVEQGWAWNSVKYSKSEELAALEEQARKDKNGLWAKADPIPPWEWRKIEEEKSKAKKAAKEKAKKKKKDK